MSHVLLGVTGSVAATRTPALFSALRGHGHDVRLVATEPALYFFEPADLGAEAVGQIVRDRDEWRGEHYRRDDPVLHIELRKWADLLIVAPLDANTLAKFAIGLCDNCLTCVYRAWDFQKPVVLAPAMNTLMWQSPITRRHLEQLLEDRGDGRHPRAWSLEDADRMFASHAPGIVLVPPSSKRLACGDIGVGAMAEVITLAEIVRRWAVNGDEPTAGL
jgi:phosphopantothenoylcysteine decarboxylase